MQSCCELWNSTRRDCGRSKCQHDSCGKKCSLRRRSFGVCCRHSSRLSGHPILLSVALPARMAHHWSDAYACS
jgi:hypothetical protein